MANDNFTGTTLSGAPVAYRWAFHRGWGEAQNGQAFCRSYDTEMSITEQIAYESGRLVVVNVLASKQSVPSWAGYHSGCALVERAAGEAARRIGSSIPGCVW